MIPGRKTPLRAIVQGVYDSGQGRYVVTKPETDERLGSVTFSLETGERVWTEECEPSNGEVVLLEDLVETRAGWRAKSARYARPSDEGN